MKSMLDTTVKSERSRRLRRLFRFSLRTLLVAFLVISLLAGIQLRSARRQERSVAKVRELGGSVYYDYQWVGTRMSSDPSKDSRVPAWLLDQFGVDFFHDVVEINMVYNDDTGSRLDNNRLSDAVLFELAGFPKLKTLLLKETQVTDEGLKQVGRLDQLERLFMWDARLVTDAGIANLQNCRKLEYLHCSYSQITDEAIRHLSSLPSLEVLTLQGNHFTDKALEYAGTMVQLKSIWLGLGDNWITDEGLVHLNGMTSLERLGIQHSQVTDRGLEHLKGLTNLKVVCLRGSNVSQQGTAELRKALPGTRIDP